MTQDDGLFAFDVEEPELEAVEPEVVETRAPLPAIPVQPIQAETANPASPRRRH